MTNTTTKRPYPSQFSSYIVNHPLQSSHGQRWINELGFNLGFNLHQVGSMFFSPINGAYATLTGSTVTLQYQRSPGAQFLVIDGDLAVNPYTTLPIQRRDCYIDLTTLPTSASHYSTNPFDSSLTGSLRLLEYPPTTLATAPRYRTVLDVSNTPSASIQDIVFTVHNETSGTTSTAGQGFNTLTLTEVPLVYSLPATSPTTEVSADINWASPSFRLYNGSVSSSLGFNRLEDQLDRARNRIRKHWQISCHLDTFRTWRCFPSAASTNTTIDWRAPAATMTSERRGFIRTRNLYGLSATNTWVWRAWYKTSSLSAPATFTMNWRRMGDTGAFTVKTLSLAASTTVYTAVSTSVDFAVNGTDQEIEFYFSGSVNNNGEGFYLSSIALIENETS